MPEEKVIYTIGPFSSQKMSAAKLLKERLFIVLTEQQTSEESSDWGEPTN
jgi:hypothetical protein